MKQHASDTEMHFALNDTLEIPSDFLPPASKYILSVLAMACIKAKMKKTLAEV